MTRINTNGGGFDFTDNIMPQLAEKIRQLAGEDEVTVNVNLWALNGPAKAVLSKGGVEIGVVEITPALTQAEDEVISLALRFDANGQVFCGLYRRVGTPEEVREWRRKMAALLAT